MALTAGVPVPLGAGTPTRRFLVPIILDGSDTSQAIVHGITGAPGAPDVIQPAFGGTATVYISNAVANSTDPDTTVDVTVSGAGSASQTLYLLLEWLTAF